MIRGQKQLNAFLGKLPGTAFIERKGEDYQIFVVTGVPENNQATMSKKLVAKLITEGACIAPSFLVLNRQKLKEKEVTKTE